MSRRAHPRAGTPGTPKSARGGRRRAVAAVLLAVAIALGLATHRLFPDAQLADIAGDALYSVAVYLGVVLLAPRARPWVPATLAIGWSFAVEFLQLTVLPARAAEAFAPARLVLGSGFDARDLLVYALAGLLALGVDVAATGISARRNASPLVP